MSLRTTLCCCLFFIIAPLFHSFPHAGVTAQLHTSRSWYRVPKLFYKFPFSVHPSSAPRLFIHNFLLSISIFMLEICNMIFKTFGLYIQVSVFWCRCCSCWFRCSCILLGNALAKPVMKKQRSYFKFLQHPHKRHSEPIRQYKTLQEAPNPRGRY